jgi:hypothetical protein
MKDALISLRRTVITMPATIKNAEVFRGSVGAIRLTEAKQEMHEAPQELTDQRKLKITQSPLKQNQRCYSLSSHSRH